MHVLKIRNEVELTLDHLDDTIATLADIFLAEELAGPIAHVSTEGVIDMAFNGGLITEKEADALAHVFTGRAR